VDHDARVAGVDGQGRQHRPPHADSDHGLHRPVVVRAEHVPRLDADRAQRAVDEVLTARVVLPDHRHAPEERAGLALAGCARAASGDDDEGVVAEVRARQPFVVELRPDDERQVEVALEHPLEQHLEAVRFEEPDLEVRPLLAKGADDGRQHVHGDALERAHDEPAAVTGLEQGELVASLAEPSEDGLGVLEQHPTRRGHLDGPRAPRTIEHGLADDALEGRDLLAHCGLGEAEPLGGSAERALVGHRAECHQMADLQVAEQLVRNGVGRETIEHVHQGN
jgi:hypothetical protein